MYAVEMRGIVKQYPLVRAVDNADFLVKNGEIHSLLGENGAGKSTLMKILYGIEQPTKGEIKINGNVVQIDRPSRAINLGIGMVHQHFMLTPVMSVAENIVIGCEPVQGLFFDQKAAVAKVDEMIKQYGFRISASEKVKNLSVGEQQRVEILKALYRGADILILDEPTAVLTPNEVEELFQIMRKLKSAGKSIVIITHKLKETMEIADRVSVLRDGKMVETGLGMEGITVSDLARMMVGRNVELQVTRKSEGIKEAYFKVHHLTATERGSQVLKDVNFEVHKGEILGLAGIEGNGQSELIEVLTGLRKTDSLDLYMGDQPVTGDAGDFIQKGIGHIPEDRMTRGLVLDMTLEENMILGYHRQSSFENKGIFKSKAVRSYVNEKMEEYRVKAPNAQVRLNALSGGNQQKVVIARVFSQNPEVIVVAQPTRGVDVGAQEYIHNRLLDLRDEGKAVLLISADLDEVLCLSDRLLVMYDGRIVAETIPGEMSETELGLLMTGGSQQKEGKKV